MDRIAPGALLLVCLVAGIGLFSLFRQFQTLARLRRELHLPSDDRAYLSKQANRRIIVGFLLLALAGMMIWTYVSGAEEQADRIGAQHDQRIQEGREWVPPTEEQKEFTRKYVFIWVVILILIFLIVGMAMLDLLATRRYALQQYQRIRNDHRALLERDLAIYKQQRNERLQGRGGISS